MPADSIKSPLTLAACGGQVELADERGANIEEEHLSEGGRSPVMKACRGGKIAASVKPEDGHVNKKRSMGLDQLEDEEEDKKAGRIRGRKRRIYVQILKQMEFYFSDGNVSKNRMMQDLISASEYVDLNVFLTFNKIQKLTASVEDIKKALVSSDKVTLSSDRAGVKRIVPYRPDKLKSKDEQETCTIYVENIPRHVDHDWLETIFQVFGPVSYISLPKFRHNRQPKGFAFIEFENEEAANRCLEAYGQKEGGVLDCVEPQELLSIQTFHEHEDSASLPSYSEPYPSKRMRWDDNEDESSWSYSVESHSTYRSSTYSKKRKAEDADSGQAAKKVKEESEDTETEETESSVYATETPTRVAAAVAAALKNMPPPEEGAEKKKKRRRQKAKIKLERDSIQLRVLPKKKWRQLRNRYLNLQRDNMSKLKKQLHEQRLRAAHYQNFHYSEDDPNAAVLKRRKGIIVRIELASPAESFDAFRSKICGVVPGENPENHDGIVQFVDYTEGETQAYIRLDSNFEKAVEQNEFIATASREFKSVKILNAEDVDAYWVKVKETQKKKRKEVPRKNVRGRERLLKAAEKARGSHIYFDNDDEEKDNGQSGDAVDSKFENQAKEEYMGMWNDG